MSSRPNASRSSGDIIVITSSRTTATWAESAALSRGQVETRLHLRPTVLLLSEAEAEALLSEEHPELGVFAAFAMHERYGDKAKLVVSRALQLAAKLPADFLRTRRPARVEACTDRATLERAATASALDEVFSEP